MDLENIMLNEMSQKQKGKILQYYVEYMLKIKEFKHVEIKNEMVIATSRKEEEMGKLCNLKNKNN
jgi:hypothetical protein